MIDLLIERLSSIFNFDNCGIIVYGSNIYSDYKKSDLDFCIIVEDKECINKLELEQTIRKFHIDNNLEIDEEVPFSNKLLYSFFELENISTTLFPFQNEHGDYEINDISKEANYLCSERMHLRLLVNILTTDNRVYTNNIQIKNFIKMNSNKVKMKMIDSIVNFYNKQRDVNTILNLMYENPYTKSCGEDYLGYKKGNMYKEDYLKKWITDVINMKDDNNI